MKKTEELHFRTESWTKEYLEKIADEKGIPKSTFANRLLKLGLAAHKLGLIDEFNEMINQIREQKEFCV